MKIKLFLLAVCLVINCYSAQAQDDCQLDKPLVITELKGRLLFEHNMALFSVREADININKKGEGAFYRIEETRPNSDGYFEIKGLKTGKYYLSVDSLVGLISLLEFEVVAKKNHSVTDNLVEIVLKGWGNKCEIKTVKNFENYKITGSNALPEWNSITEISLEHTGCFGSCPQYKVTLRKDGTATYIARDFASKPKGTFQGKFEYGFERLAELIYRQGFFNLKNRYDAPFTDLDTAIITVIKDGNPKAVINYGGVAPVEFWGIETAIDSLVDDVKWNKNPDLPKK